MKLDAADGDISWMTLVGGADALDDRGWSIIIGTDDQPVVTGLASTSTDPGEFLTVKFDSVTGHETWRRTLPGAINHPDRRAGWLALADNGDIIMANRTWGASYDVALHRYAPANGATVWAIQHDGPSSGPDDPLAMVRDADGDLLVAGIQSGDYMVLKFDQTDGGLIWSANYDGPPGWYDAATCVGEGPDGEVVVSGYSDDEDNGWDVTTVGFDPITGSQLWADRFDAGDGMSDEPRALAVSPLGDLYVVGYGYMEDSGSDMLALRYLLGGAAGVATSLDLPGPSRMLLSSFPNPGLAEVSLSFVLPQPASARVAVYDVRGHLQVVLHDGWLESGKHRLSWDGDDLRGLPVAAGVYLARIESGGLVAGRKIVLSR